MAGCKEKEELLMRYLDRELDPKEAAEFARHLEACNDCAEAAAKNRRMEELFGEDRSLFREEAGIDRFVHAVRARIAAEGIVHPKRRPVLRMGIGLAAAAASVLLVWLFHAADVQKEEEISGDRGEESIVEIDRSTEALEARRELGRILVELSEVSDDALLGRFEKAVNSLRSRGWRVEMMLSGALKHEEGPALRTTLRLAARIPGFDRTPGVIPALSRLLQKESFPRETMEALAVLDGPRGASALGRALTREEYREQALELLSNMEGDEPVRLITEALYEEQRRSSGVFTPFVVAAVGVLAHKGTEGLEGILKAFERSGYDPEYANALSPLDRDFASRLMDRLWKEQGILFEAGCELAALLRLEDAVYVLGNEVQRDGLGGGAPLLIARVGGARAVVHLVYIFEEPISLRQRRKVCEALGEVFRLYPEELEGTLEEAVTSLPEESREVLVEMLSKDGAVHTCRALGRILETRSDLAPSAALALARTGSGEALAELMDLLRSGQLNSDARIAAGAAAYFLGGREVLREITGETTEDAGPDYWISLAERGDPSRPGTLTLNRFQKLQTYIARKTNS